MKRLPCKKLSRVVLHRPLLCCLVVMTTPMLSLTGCSPSEQDSGEAIVISPKGPVEQDPVPQDETQTNSDAEETTSETAMTKEIEEESVTDDSLVEAIDALEIPPPWFDTVTIDYDTAQPWGEARQEIRRLLSLGGEHIRQAIKLTYLYHEKDDIGDGHEYPMYLFMGGEHVWAVREHQRFTEGLMADEESFTHVHAFLTLVSLYSHFGQYDKALETIEIARNRLPDPPWRIAREAEIEDALGDIYASMGRTDDAKPHYEEAIRLYPTSDQPYGRHELKRKAGKVQSKIDLLDQATLETATLRDGTYRALTLGYSGDIDVTVEIRNSRIFNMDVKHEEKIDLNASKIIPQRIIASQSLGVDAITGATVTCDAIVDGTFQALKKAGLE